MSPALVLPTVVSEAWPTLTAVNWGLASVVTSWFITEAASAVKAPLRLIVCP